MSELEAISWTTDFLDWVPWIETVDEVGVSADQRARIDATLGSRAGSTYYETLASDLESVRTRTLLFSDIFESEGGVPRADRELAATATISHQWMRVLRLCPCPVVRKSSKERTLVRGLLDEGVTTSLPPHQRAIVDLSSKLTTDPESLTAADLDRVRAIGISDLGILDLIQSAAIFANANRLMLTLGEPARKRQ